MTRSSALQFVVHARTAPFSRHCAFHSCCKERGSSDIFKREFPGANPICLSLLSVPSTTMTVIRPSIILRGEGVIYPFLHNDFITKAKISFRRMRELSNKKKVFIAFTNCTVLVERADAK